jgi:hypothetical protein
MKTSKHLGQSVSMFLLLALSSVGVIGIIAMQSGALR